MDQDVSGNILNMTLEIIYLLTGENYGPMKEKSRNSTLPFLPPEGNIDKKILEITQKIIELLTGEVPIRCQDVAVYFSMEEWEYVEGHKELYKDVMMASQPALTSPDPPSSNEDPIIVINPLSDRFTSAEEQSTTNTLKNIGKAGEEEREHFPQPDKSETTQHTQTTSTCVKEEHLTDEDTTHSHSDFKVETLLDEEHLLQPDICTLTQHTQYPSAHYEDSFPYEEHHIQNEYDPYEHSTTTHDQGEYVPVFYTPLCFDQSANTQDPRSCNKPFACFECNMFFRVRSELVAHQRSHAGQKPYCFTSSSSLAPQQMLHTATTSYPCPDCGKFFSTYSNLGLHRKIHLGVKPYSCPECGKCFLRNSHLTRHRQSHVGDRVKPYTCTECGKSFLSRSSFVVHWRSHTGENPYTCSECGKSFPAYSCLVQHWRVHTGEKPYPCSECGKRFAAHSNLTLHYRIHTGEKPYCCSECGKRFVRNSHLRRHRKCHTGVAFVDE